MHMHMHMHTYGVLFIPQYRLMLTHMEATWGGQGKCGLSARHETVVGWLGGWRGMDWKDTLYIALDMIRDTRYIQSGST